MKRNLTLTLAVCLFAATAYADLKGSWTASTDEDKDGRVHLNMSRRGRGWNMGNTFNLSALSGLSQSQIDSATQIPVTFDMKREAGHVVFEGFFRNGDGAGHFTFTPNRNYLTTLRSMGLEPRLRSRKDRDETDGGREEDELFSLALHDVSTDFIRTMRAEGFNVSLDKYTSMRIFNVTPEYIKEMRSLGYKDISADKLVETRIHKVTPDYIRKMRAVGWDLPLSKLVASRIHGATPEFAAEMARLGYKLDHDDLIAFRIHRVTPEFIEEMRKIGYDKLDGDDLVSMRIHGVNAEFVRELEAAGYKNVPVDKLVAMKIHGIDAKFIKRMNDVD
jgi:hypothetical protein